MKRHSADLVHPIRGALKVNSFSVAIVGIVRNMPGWRVCAQWAAAAVLALAGAAALAVESGSGVYLLGSKGPGAGLAPPPGIYFSSDNYFYSGDDESDEALPGDGNSITIGTDAEAFSSINSLLWVPEKRFLGGQGGIGVSLPVVVQDLDARAVLNLDGVPISLGGITESDTAIGDPLLVGLLGWNHGLWNSTLHGLVNVPIGSYDQDNLVTAGFNRWVVDVTLGLTYLNPANGWEFSIAPGVTINGENKDTKYDSGNEFHVEFGVMRHFSPKFGLGLMGYHYEQFTDDKGSAAGDFRGRVTALGPVVSFNFAIGKLPVIMKLKYLEEFNVKNRLDGSAGFLQLVIPLAGPSGN